TQFADERKVRRTEGLVRGGKERRHDQHGRPGCCEWKEYEDEAAGDQRTLDHTQGAKAVGESTAYRTGGHCDGAVERERRAGTRRRVPETTRDIERQERQGHGAEPVDERGQTEH